MATDKQPAPGHSSVAADVDAYRRYRSEPPPRAGTALSDLLAGVDAADVPIVVFSRIAEASVPAFSDGCDVEIIDGDEPSSRESFAASPRVPSDAVRNTTSTTTAVAGCLSVPVAGRARTGYGSYTGMMNFWWHQRRPVTSDATIAGLIVQRGLDLVDQSRLISSLAASEGRGADSAMNAIVTRQICIAVGILMRDRACDEKAAEECLRELATEQGTNVYSVAAQVVRGARDASIGTDTAAATTRRLRSVDPPQ